MALFTHHRMGFIGGSDAVKIVQGKWHSLWMEKTGRTEPEDLSGEFIVQLGVYTEPFHARWLTDHMDMLVQPPSSVPGGMVFTHAEYGWMKARIDGWLPLRDTFVELKHSHGSNNAQDAALYYLPQIAHYCNVLDVSHGYLSVICGNREPEVIKVEPAAEYRRNLIELEQQFWIAVTENLEPDVVEQGAAKLKAEAKTAKLDDMRAIDMTGNNAWAHNATVYSDTLDAYQRHDKAKKELKELVPEDAYEVSGSGLVIKRDKRGALRFSKAA